MVLRFLENQPDSSSREISKAIYLPRRTILRVLDDIGLRLFAPRRILHRFSREQNADRVELSQHGLDMTHGLGPKQQKYIITGDKSRIYWDNRRRGTWAKEGDELPSNVKQTISSKRRWFRLISGAVVLFQLNSFGWGKV
jgi:hypothetical protein